MNSLEQFVRETVAQLRPLTDEQCAHVAELLRPTAKRPGA